MKNTIFKAHAEPGQLARSFWFETLKQPGLSGGSKLRAYRRARCRAIEAGRYVWRDKGYVFRARPLGFLP